MATPAKPLLEDVGVMAMVPDLWGALWQPRHHVLSRLARYFHVVWVNPPHEWHDSFKSRRDSAAPLVDCPPGFAVFDSPLWLPKIYRPRWLAKFTFKRRLELARRVLMRRGCRKTVLYVWRPELGEALNCVPFDLSCYHIDDEYSFSAVETAIPDVEARLIADVGQVFIHSPALLDKKGKINPHTAFVPNGVDYHAYATAVGEPADLAPIPHPRIGYTGHIKKQLDWPLLLSLSAQHPEWSFVLVGPVNPHPEILPAIQKLSRQANVFFLGSKTVWELAAYPQHFDVCIMPYRQDAYTRYIYPLKLHEYLAAGRPTVGTRLPSLAGFSDVVLLVETPEQWNNALVAALSPAEQNDVRRAARQAVAKRNDWDVLVEKIAGIMAERLGKHRLVDPGGARRSP